MRKLCDVKEYEQHLFTCICYSWSQYLEERTFGGWAVEGSAKSLRCSGSQNTQAEKELPYLANAESSFLTILKDGHLEVILGQPTIWVNGSVKCSLYTEAKYACLKFHPFVLSLASEAKKRTCMPTPRAAENRNSVLLLLSKASHLNSWRVITNNHQQNNFLSHRGF